MPSDESIQGPAGFENWLAADQGIPSHSAFELQLYSDARFTDELLTGVGPYSFHNVVSPISGEEFTHVLTLRVENHVVESYQTNFDTDTTRYHGGGMADEISSLSGLLLGARVQPGRISREFRGTDPRGYPRADYQVPNAPIPRLRGSSIVPQARESKNIRSALLPLLATYPRLSPALAVVLVRAARLYQNALWVVEAEPELAWLFFVSAIEVIATQHQAMTQSDEEILKLGLPKLYKAIRDAGSDELLSQCASHLSRQLRATKRFLGFIEQFRPSEPWRPAEKTICISWEWPSLKQALSQIYNYRSLALHEGIPFPWPMSEPPCYGDFYMEQPFGLAVSTFDGTWAREDLPMLIHVFEHITRGAILNWWKSLTEVTPDTPAANPS